MWTWLGRRDGRIRKVCLESTAALVDSNVGEQGGVAWREDGRYGKVGGIDGGGAGGN